ncbi:MAG: hypothetical protein R3C97_03970 [Geminicoccaceae bacterium]
MVNERSGPLAVLVMASLLGGCASLDLFDMRSEDEVAKEAAESLWAVFPSAPRYKKELAKAPLAGSAVAAGDNRFLVECSSIEDPARIGIARLRKYEVAHLAGRIGDACLIESDPTDINLPTAFRARDDLRPGEAVTSLHNLDPGNFAAMPARLHVQGDIVWLDRPLPEGVTSAVIVDDRGNLVGLAAADGRIATLAPHPEMTVAAIERSADPVIQINDEDRTPMIASVAETPADRDETSGPDEKPAGDVEVDERWAAIEPGAGEVEEPAADRKSDDEPEGEEDAANAKPATTTSSAKDLPEAGATADGKDTNDKSPERAGKGGGDKDRGEKGGGKDRGGKSGNDKDRDHSSKDRDRNDHDRGGKDNDRGRGNDKDRGKDRGGKKD